MKRMHSRLAMIAAASLFVASCTPGLLAVAWPGDLAEVPEEQRPALTDRIVDLDEYQAAVVAWSACIEDSGVPVVDIELEPSNLYSISVYQGERSADEVDNVVNTCEARHLTVVEQQWTRQLEAGQIPSTLPEYWASMRSCLQDSGADFGVVVTSDDYFDVMRNHGAAYGACQATAAAAIPGAVPKA